MHNTFATTKDVDSAINPVAERVSIIEENPILTATLCNGAPVPSGAQLAQCSDLVAATGITIQDEGVSKTTTRTINFIGDGVTVAQNDAAQRADVTIPSFVTIPKTIAIAQVPDFYLTTTGYSSGVTYTANFTAPVTGWYSCVIAVEGLVASGTIGPISRGVTTFGTLQITGDPYPSRPSNLAAFTKYITYILEAEGQITAYTEQESRAVYAASGATVAVTIFTYGETPAGVTAPQIRAKDVTLAFRQLTNVVPNTPLEG
jgi:hypothetical protein